MAKDDSDVDNVTTLLRLGKGLQVLDRSKDPPIWLDAAGPIILVGDMARSLMRNQVRAGSHRVVGNANGRGSIVFTLRPYLKHATDLSAFGGQGIVDTKEYFDKIKARKFNINATKDVRKFQQNALQRRTQAAGDCQEAAFGHG
ncbi:hypothetical protein LTR85_000769 [Meristemomyces frigidus]|nr:hypothetical protein LTR85_000769 [Meristemomyces frigidus]